MDPFQFGGEGGIVLVHPCTRPLRGAVAIAPATQSAVLPIGRTRVQIKSSQSTKLKKAHQGLFQFGGEGGIRTLDTVRYTHFPGVLLRPLGHLSTLK